VHVVPDRRLHVFLLHVARSDIAGFGRVGDGRVQLRRATPDRLSAVGVSGLGVAASGGVWESGMAAGFVLGCNRRGVGWNSDAADVAQHIDVAAQFSVGRGSRRLRSERVVAVGRHRGVPDVRVQSRRVAMGVRAGDARAQRVFLRGDDVHPVRVDDAPGTPPVSLRAAAGVGTESGESPDDHRDDFPIRARNVARGISRRSDGQASLCRPDGIRFCLSGRVDGRRVGQCVVAERRERLVVEPASQDGALVWSENRCRSCCWPAGARGRCWPSALGRGR